MAYFPEPFLSYERLRRLTGAKEVSIQGLRKLTGIFELCENPSLSTKLTQLALNSKGLGSVALSLLPKFMNSLKLLPRLSSLRLQMEVKADSFYESLCFSLSHFKLLTGLFFDLSFQGDSLSN